MKIHVVSATRSDRDSFWNTGALGLSLRRLSEDTRLVPWIAYENTLGLPAIYNQALNSQTDGDIIVFMHDDVWLDDLYFGDRIQRGLDYFDVIGIAGNRRRVEKQPGWAFVDQQFNWDERSNLSGAVAHGKSAFGKPTIYGLAPERCELLDGILLATRANTLSKTGCRFDPRFMFHFYDLDFCRTASAAGLRLGTWPISVTHQSGGAFGTESWWRGYGDYLDKWKQ
ncbi:MAG: hypothetical protein WBD34_10600 [Burkholderiaceae bacterium]